MLIFNFWREGAWDSKDLKSPRNVWDEKATGFSFISKDLREAGFVKRLEKMGFSSKGSWRV